MEATIPHTPAYSHRQNPDHTFDSICHRCFSTVAREATESALAKHEQRHKCDALAKARMLVHKDRGMSIVSTTTVAVDAA